MNISSQLKETLHQSLQKTAHGHCTPSDALMDLIKHIEEELAKAVKVEQSRNRALLRLVAEIEKLTQQIQAKKDQDMIDNALLEASATRLEAAAQAIINALPGNTVPSTADTVVAAFQGRVDGASAALEAAAATGSAGT